MAYDFTDDDKEIKEFAERIPFGVTKVQFTGALADETEAGKDFIEIGVVAENGVEDSARLWFVGGASNISFNTAHDIAVHQGKDEEEKQKIRDRVNACKNNVELCDVLNDVCANGGELWFTKYYDATRTYTNEHGTFRSVNKNVLGYEPKEKPELMPKPAESAKTADDLLAGSTPADKEASDNIPTDWAK